MVSRRIEGTLNDSKLGFNSAENDVDLYTERRFRVFEITGVLVSNVVF